MARQTGGGGADKLRTLQNAYEQMSNRRRRSMVINGVALSEAMISALEQTWGPVADGIYWYDPICGAWGVEGGPCVGYCTAGLQLGGPLRANASNGRTGAFVNGRELPLVEWPYWQSLGLQAPARYWLDAAGNYGPEGGMAWGNVAAANQPAGDRPWIHRSRFGRFGTMGSDGEGHYFFFDKKNSWSS